MLRLFLYYDSYRSEDKNAVGFDFGQKLQSSRMSGWNIFVSRRRFNYAGGRQPSAAQPSYQYYLGHIAVITSILLTDKTTGRGSIFCFYMKKPVYEDKFTVNSR